MQEKKAHPYFFAIANSYLISAVLFIFHFFHLYLYTPSILLALIFKFIFSLYPHYFMQGQILLFCFLRSFHSIPSMIFCLSSFQWRGAHLELIFQSHFSNYYDSGEKKPFKSSNFLSYYHSSRLYSSSLISYYLFFPPL